MEIAVIDQAGPVGHGGVKNVAAQGGVKLWCGVVVVAVQRLGGDQDQAKVKIGGGDGGVPTQQRGVAVVVREGADLGGVVKVTGDPVQVRGGGGDGGGKGGVAGAQLGQGGGQLGGKDRVGGGVERAGLRFTGPGAQRFRPWRTSATPGPGRVDR